MQNSQLTFIEKGVLRLQIEFASVILLITLSSSIITTIIVNYFIFEVNKHKAYVELYKDEVILLRARLEDTCCHDNALSSLTVRVEEETY